MYNLYMKIPWELSGLKNPFGAAIYHEETVSSTFDAARILAGRNEGHGTVISADFQQAGRGRLERSWTAARGQNLLFTILLRYADFASIPSALTLRTGLSVSMAIEEQFPPLAGQVMVKWPNDIMIGGRKIVGILVETDGSTAYIGVGVNITQTEFSKEYSFKAGSIIQFLPELKGDLRFDLLEKILFHLHAEIEAESSNWRERLLKRLYKKGETVTFIEGAEQGLPITGTLSGIGAGGELLLIPEGEKEERAFITGELRVYL